MYPHPNPLKIKLQNDQCITGIYVQTDSPDCIEIAAASGLDYVIIDMEHGAFGLDPVVQMIRSAEATGVCPLVRVPDHSEAMIRKVVEAGAMGVYIPDVRNAEQARKVISATKYLKDNNQGTKGACPTSRATRGLGANWENFISWSNDNIMVTILVECEEGLRNLDDILKTPGIDTIVLGRFDIAHELGLYGNRYGSELNAIFEGFAKKAKSAGVHYVARLKQAPLEEMRNERATLVANGARIFTMGSDRELIARAFNQTLLPMRD